MSTTVDQLAKSIPNGQADLQPAETPAAAWPDPLGHAALTGLAGDVVRLIEPTTESDPAAILFQFLVMFGNLIGRTAHWVVEDTIHYCNLFLAIVGDTAKGRKGTSLDRTRNLYRGVDDEWMKRIQSGLSSGEGLIWFVRDPIIEAVQIKDKGRTTGYEEMETDPGEKDKRALIVESEFARVLSVTERQGNTLSPIIRDAWDGKPLGTMTKTKAARCTDPHVSIIGHVTKDELGRSLTDTAVANGFANRFLFACARRSKMLPFGGDQLDLSDIHIRLRSAINNARRCGEIPMDAEARKVWAVEYERLTSGGGNGLFASVIARAEAQTRRLACIYALLDESPYVRLEHLYAGLEAWRYCEDSCRAIFGDSLGDPTADEIMGALRRAKLGMTRTELIHHFQRHKKADEIGRALDTLQRTGKAHSEREDTGGRPTERWFAM